MTPFEWGSQHVHVVGWGTVIFLVWRAGKLFTYVTDLLKKKSMQFDELHVAVTNHLTHAIPDAAAKVAEKMEQHDRHEDAGHHEIALAVREEGRETRALLATLLGRK